MPYLGFTRKFKIVRLRDPQRYAHALRDQAIADFQCATVLMNAGVWVAGGRTGSYAHAAIAKLQQSEEKILKGYLLYASREAFNPFTKHCVVTIWREDHGRVGRHLNQMLSLVEGKKVIFIKQLEELEALAPSGADGVQVDERDEIVAIARNTEYPYHLRQEEPTFPAISFSIVDGIRHQRTIAKLLKIMARNPPYDYTTPIGEFVEQAGL